MGVGLELKRILPGRLENQNSCQGQGQVSDGGGNFELFIVALVGQFG